MSERRYTEPFFLDEATAFATGHRPCAECRRKRFNAFKEAWRRARRLDNDLLLPRMSGNHLQRGRPWLLPDEATSSQRQNSALKSLGWGISLGCCN